MTIKVEKDKKNQKLDGYNPKMFRSMKIVYTLLSLINLVVVIASFALVGFSLYDAQRSYAAISTVEENVLKSNNSVMMMVVDVKTTQEEIDKIYRMFDEIEKARAEFEELENLDVGVTSRFYQAFTAINNYKLILRECAEQYNASVNDEKAMAEFQNQILPLYRDSLEPSMKQAADLMSQAVDEQQTMTINIFFTTAKSFLIVLLLLIAILVLGLICIYQMQKASYRSAEELQKRANEVEKTSEKLSKSRDKTKAIAYTNVLTGLKNRYALEEDLEPRLEKDSFYISNFDFDNFRGFNEVYGRNMGDALMAAVAERLKNDFGEHAEIYNITSDEFSFVFKPSVSGAQATNMTQRIFEAMSGYYTIENVTVQLNVSGCTYHYLAGEYISMNSLLSKMDSVMHQAKSNGGKTVLEVR